MSKHWNGFKHFVLEMFTGVQKVNMKIVMEPSAFKELYARVLGH